MPRLTVRFRKLRKSYLEAIVIGLVLAFCIRFFVFAPFQISTLNMFPELNMGDLVFVYKPAYGINFPIIGKLSTSSKPEFGDIVLFKNQSKDFYISRVLGVEGDTVLFQGNDIFVNDQKLDIQNISFETDSTAVSDLVFKKQSFGSREILVSYKSDEAQIDIGPWKVAPGQVFLLNDNRNSSDDSRYFSEIPLEAIHGKVILIGFSYDKTNSQFRSGRFFKLID